MLKISWAMHIRWSLHLALVWTRSTCHLRRQHVPNEIGACDFAAGEEAFRRRRDKCVWTDLGH